MKVGFIGLGRMGQGMAGRIHGAGYALAIYDAAAAQTASLAAVGARAAASVADLCQERDVIVTMLVEDATILSVTTGPEGLVDSLTPGAIHLVMGTHGVATIRTLEQRHAEAGQILVAAPVTRCRSTTPRRRRRRRWRRSAPVPRPASPTSARNAT